MVIKHTFLAVLFFVIACVEGYSQSAYYGAQYLNTIDSAFVMKVMNMEKQKDSEIVSVIFFSKNEKLQLVYLDSFLKNPFSQNIGALDYNLLQNAFEKYYQTSKIQLLYDLDISAQPSKVFAYSLPPFKSVTPPAIFETNLTDAGIHYYTAEPFRPEQTALFMNNFKDATKTKGELKIFFPETFKKLKYSDLSKFPDFGNSLKKIYSEDLNNIFDNLFNYIENYPQGAVPDGETSFLKERNIAIIKASDNYFPLKLSVEVMNKVSNGYNPVSLLNYLDKKYYNASAMSQPSKNVKDKIGAALHGLNIIQTALRDTASFKRKANLWISFEQLNDLKAKERKYFIGLVYQKDIAFFNQQFSFNKSTSGEVIMNTLEPYINNVLDQISAIQEFINSGATKGRKENYMKYLTLHYNLIISNPFMPNEVKQFFSNGSDLIYIYDNVHNRSYNTTLYYTLKILNDLQNRQEFTHEMRTVEYYAEFLTDIVNCNSSEQLTEVIKKYVPKK